MGNQAATTPQFRGKSVLRAGSKTKAKETPIDFPEDVSIEEALKGQQLLCAYCARKMAQARGEDDLPKYLFWNAIASTVSDTNLGLLVGSLVFRGDFIKALYEMADQETALDIPIID